MKVASVIALLGAASAKMQLANDEALIAEINAKNPGWTAGANSRFDGVTLADVKKLLGTRFADAARLSASSTGQSAPRIAAPPASFDARDQWQNCPIIGKIRDQSACGCCWAFGTTESINDRACISGTLTPAVELSAQEMCSCCSPANGYGSDGCNGGFLDDAWNYAIKVGLVTGGDYEDIGAGTTCFPVQMPTCAHHEPSKKYPNCSATEYRTPACPASSGCTEKTYATAWASDKHHAKTGYALRDAADIQNDLVARGPVSVAFEVYADFITYKSGVYKHVSGSALGGHAVKIIGYGTDAVGGDYWIVANSWNDSWGINGTFWIARGHNECGIESQAYAGTI